MGFLALSEGIYDDASRSRPAFPGAPDDYRRRAYDVAEADEDGGGWVVKEAPPS